MFLHDMKQRAEKWQLKQQRLRHVLISSGLFVLAVIVSVVWNMVQGNDVRWIPSLVLAGAGLGVGVFSLSAYTNTTLVAMYYNACYHYVATPEELEMVTGTLESVHTLQIPYIGSLYQVTLQVAGEAVRLYCPGKLLRGLRPHERIRVRSYDLFAISVETTGLIETPATETTETTETTKLA
jgi:hypothetical protein